ncbi:ion channel [Catenovulum adriaticum]|uniref:Pentapeptide repeat-containing protein n=1 Tax=Catenovulum adriaticum TaxID=2984846 RepID=A0ABY7ANE6_9ALTE|nr:pentapeptide repeat-containing protein [Catenovulum sp. TS8]WAJ71088.1 pentapeptide repeat-containing protein [Catenovulum sp. TS8]
MQADEKFGTCQFSSSDGHYCQEVNMGNGFCFWHDPNFDKQGMALADKLERFVNNGGITQGLQLKYADLSGINLVKKDSKLGYDFSGSNLYRANLSHAHLFNIKFNNASLMKANLTDANLHCAQLTQANLLGVKLANTKIDNIQLGTSLIQETKASELIDENDAAKRQDLYQQSEEIYRDIRKAAEHQGLFDLTSHCIYKELTMRRMQMPALSKPRIISKMVDLFCGYGEKPVNVIIFSFVFILGCALAYFLFGIQQNMHLVQLNFEQSLSQNISHFVTALYYSVITFTTLGYDNIAPIGISRLIAAIQAFSGSFIMALFVLVFVKKMTR